MLKQLRSVSAWLLFLCLIGISSLGHTTPLPPSTNLDKVQLQLKWFHDFAFAGYYAAIEQGYYAEEGLDVTLQERNLEKDVVQQVADGESEYGIAGSGLLSAYANGTPVKALAAIFQHDPLAYFTLQDSGIVSPYEMLGKRIMTDTLSADQAPLISLLSKAHFKKGDYTLVEQNNDYHLLIERKVDVISGYLTDQTYYYQQQNTPINIIRPFNYGVDFYGDILFTSDKEIQLHPDRVERFRRASLKGWQYALDNSDEIIQLIKDKYHSPLTIEHLQFERDEVYKLIVPNIIPLGQIDTARLKSIAGTHAEAGFNRSLSDDDIANFIYTKQPNKLELTEDELAWLALHPTIYVGVDRDFAPYEWIDDDGYYVGMAADYIRLIEKKLGIHFEIIGDKSWAEIIDMAKKGQLDMLSAAAFTPERSAYLNFIKPYKSAPIIIVDSGQSEFIGNLDNLKGKKVSLEKGYFMEELLRTNHPEIEVLPASGTIEALQSVIDGKVDAYVGDAGTTNYLIHKEGLLSLRFSGQTPYASQQSMAIAKKNPELFSILSKAIETIPEDQVDAIFNRWLGLKIEQGIKTTVLVKYTLGFLLFTLLFAMWIIRLRMEITKRELAETREKHRSHILELMAKANQLPEILNQIVTMVEKENPAMKCSILLFNDETKTLHLGAAPSLPTFYNEAVDGVKIGLNIGSCGTAAFLKQRVIVGDIQQHPYWANYRQLAKKANLASCWSEPIFSSQNTILGTFAIYQSEPSQPSVSDITLIEESARLASIAIEKQQSELAQRQSEEHLKLIIDNTPLCVKIVDQQGHLLEMNPMGLAMIEADSPEQAIGGDVFSLIAPSDRDAFIEFHQRICNNQAASLEYEIIGLKGGRRWVESHAVPIAMKSSGEIAHLAVTNDVTERKIANEKLQLAAKVFSHAREGIVITDAQGNIIEVNNTYCELCGYSRDELLGKNPKILNSGLQSVEFYDAMWQRLTDKGFWTGEVWNRHKNGDIFAIMLTISTVRDSRNDIQHFVALCTDITQIKEHQRQLEHIANFDVLTGLPNRALLSDRLHQNITSCQRHNRSLVVGFLDLDGFKEVNDKYGHQVGDDLLITLAQRMTKVLRDGDTIARIGGDEFVVILTDFEKVSDCEIVLNRLLDAASRPIEIDHYVIQISTSVGATVYPQDASDADQLVRHADQAMYIAKQAGKNRYHWFDIAHDEAVKTQQETLEHIKTALKEEQFVLFYQPKVNMKTGLVIGVEALIRWQHPERGLLPPSVFLPTIENDAFSVNVGDWVMNQALHQISQWQSQNLSIPISINISAYELQQTNFVERLATHLKHYPEVDSNMLELEILETSALEDISQISELMVASRKLGVRFALDDFGTGYSSLTYLKRLPANSLKIDQSFVRDMIEDKDDLAIVEGVIGLANAFNRDVIAEGVETTDHGRLLVQLGCGLAQGYGIARPMPAEEIPTWIANWKPYTSWRDA